MTMISSRKPSDRGFARQASGTSSVSFASSRPMPARCRGRCCGTLSSGCRLRCGRGFSAAAEGSPDRGRERESARPASAATACGSTETVWPRPPYGNPIGRRKAALATPSSRRSMGPIEASAMRLSLVLLLLGSSAATAPAQEVSRGVQLFESHDRAGARAEFVAALQRNDRDARAHYYLGRLAMLQNDADAAAEHFERAVKLDATTSDYHFWYGNAVAQKGSRASKLKQPFLAGR